MVECDAAERKEPDEPYEPCERIGRGDVTVHGRSRWGIVALRSTDGDLARVRPCALPKDLTSRLRTDLAGLRRQAATNAARCGGALIDATVISVGDLPAFHQVAGSDLLAFYQVAKVAEGVFLTSILVPVERGIEVQVVCFDKGDRPGRPDALSRAMSALEDLPIIRFVA